MHVFMSVPAMMVYHQSYRDRVANTIKYNSIFFIICTLSRCRHAAALGLLCKLLDGSYMSRTFADVLSSILVISIIIAEISTFKSAATVFVDKSYYSYLLGLIL